MIICVECDTRNYEGILFCEECGFPLTGMDITARKIKKTTKFSTENGLAVPHPTWGNTVLEDGGNVVMHFQADNVHVHLEQQTEVVLGRADGRTHTYPDLDLTPYGAIENGVSRMHAAIRRNEDALLLIDLGSANGTFVNGQKVAPKTPLILRDGDEVRLGRLVSHIYFE